MGAHGRGTPEQQGVIGRVDAFFALPEFVDGPIEEEFKWLGADGEEGLYVGVAVEAGVGEIGLDGGEGGEIGFESAIVGEGDGDGVIGGERIIEVDSGGKLERAARDLIGGSEERCEEQQEPEGHCTIMHYLRLGTGSARTASAPARILETLRAGARWLRALLIFS